MSVYIFPPVSVTTLPPMGGATSANQSLQITQETAINTTLGLLAKLTDTQPVSLANVVPNYLEILNLTNVMQTFTIPANAKWINVHCDDTNPGKVRVKLGGNATAASGAQYEPGRDNTYTCGGNVTVIAETATVNNKVYVTYGV